MSQVAKTLDAAVAAFHRRPLQDRYQALMLDGVVLARKTGAGALRRPVLRRDSRSVMLLQQERAGLQIADPERLKQAAEAAKSG